MKSAWVKIGFQSMSVQYLSDLQSSTCRGQPVRIVVDGGTLKCE